MWVLQEAHNLDSDCRDCASIELSLAMLDSHLQKLDEFKKALQDGVKARRKTAAANLFQPAEAASKPAGGMDLKGW